MNWFKVRVEMLDSSGTYQVSKSVFAKDSDEAYRFAIKQVQTEETGKALNARVNF